MFNHASASLCCLSRHRLKLPPRLSVLASDKICPHQRETLKIAGKRKWMVSDILYPIGGDLTVAPHELKLHVESSDGTSHRRQVVPFYCLLYLLLDHERSIEIPTSQLD